MSVVRRSAAILVTAGALTAGAAAPAVAQPNNQQGLVNVNIQDTAVQVPVAVAANVCNVAVNVLASQLTNQAAPCNATADPTATVSRPGPAGPNNQSGLVNINAQDLTIQVPVGIAANICNVSANVLAQNLTNQAATCDAPATPVATA
jgi:hypothetical protein